jgi:hypothetical protein
MTHWGHFRLNKISSDLTNLNAQTKFKLSTMKLNSKPSVILLISVLAGLIIYGCDLLKKSDNKPNDIGAGSYLATNASDPKFVKFVSLKGETVEVFGSRNSQGLPDAVTQINVTLTNGEKYSFFYNSSKTLISSTAANGTTFKYDWLANKKVALTIIPNDGKTQINTELDLSGVKSATTTTLNSNVKPRTTGNDCSDIIFTPITEEPVKAEINRFKSGSTGTTYDLYTNQCGAPVSQTIVAVNIYDQSGSVKLGEVVPIEVGKGHYTITVPSGTAPTIDPQAMVNKLGPILSLYCDGSGVLGGTSQTLMMTESACAMLAAKLALTVVGAGVAAPVGAACAGLGAAMAVYCSTLGVSGDPGTPSIMDKINELNLLDYFKIQANMRLHVVFLGLPSNFTKGFTITEGVASALTAELDENGKPKIRSLDLSPSSPAANQGYSIKVSVYCVPVNSNVTLSMVGTDGYTKSSTFPITSAAQSAGTYSLSIPGAQKGVRDDITAKVTTADGQTITSTASLIFGN